MNAPTKSEATASDREIVLSRVFDAPRERVFQMWTDPQHVGKWWGPRGFTTTLHTMDVRPGGAWEFVMHGPDGRDYQNKCVYVEVAPPERLVYDHVSGPVFRMTATFDDEGGKTRLTVRMRFESAALRDKVAQEYGAVEGLKQTVDRLGEHLADAGAGEEAFVISREFSAPRELVFRVWTEAEHLARWFGPVGFTTVAGKNDPRPGGVFHYCMRAPNGHEMWGKWVYREVAPPERLAFVSSFSDARGNTVRAPFSETWPLEVLSTVTFAERDGKTTVTMRGVPINATEAERQTFQGMHGSMRQGWGGTLDQLTEYLKGVSHG